jgi:hypothetical protein
VRGRVLVEDAAQRAVGAVGEGELEVSDAKAAAEVAVDLAQRGEAQVEEAVFLDEDDVGRERPPAAMSTETSESIESMDMRP